MTPTNLEAKKVCIIGGSFDPIHLGHLQMARSAQAQCMAEEVWFMPAGDPWQKTGRLTATGSERLEMVKLAIAGVHSWRAEAHEVKRTGPTFTVDTLEHLSERYPNYQFVFVIGADQLSRLTTWQHWRSLFDYARIGVVERSAWGGFKVPDELKTHLMQDRLFRVHMPEVNISSTEIRRQFSLAQSTNMAESEQAYCNLERWLPPKVYQYLQSNPLYSRTSD